MSHICTSADQLIGRTPLLELTNIAIQKAKDFFESDDVEVFKFMSGHSWKKDLYPEYKAKRKRNAYIRDF